MISDFNDPNFMKEFKEEVAMMVERKKKKVSSIISQVQVSADHLDFMVVPNKVGFIIQSNLIGSLD